MSTYVGNPHALLPAPTRSIRHVVAPLPSVEPIRGALEALPDTWTGLLDVDFPRDADADHVAVGPGGVFVLTVVRWDGELSLDDDILRVGGRARARAVATAKDAARAVLTTIPLLLPEDVVPVVCLESEQSLVGHVRGVLVCTTATLATALESFPEVFTPDHTDLIALFIRNGMTRPAVPGHHVGTKARRPRRRACGGRRRAA